MAAPLTWRNVDAPDFRGSMDGLRIASTAFDRAFGGLNLGLDKFQDYRKGQAESTVLNAAMGFTDPAQLRAAIADGRIFSGVDRSLLGRETLGAVNNQAGQLLTQAAAQEGLNFDRSANPLRLTGLGQINDGREVENRVASATAANRILASGLQNDATRANIRSTDAGTNSTNVGTEFAVRSMDTRLRQGELGNDSTAASTLRTQVGTAGDVVRIEEDTQKRADATWANAGLARVMSESGGDPNRARAIYAGMPGGTTTARAALLEGINRFIPDAFGPKAAETASDIVPSVTPGSGPEAPRPIRTAAQLLADTLGPNTVARATTVNQRAAHDEFAPLLRMAREIPDARERNAALTLIQRRMGAAMGRDPVVSTTSPATQGIATSVPAGSAQPVTMVPAVQQGAPAQPAPVGGSTGPAVVTPAVVGPNAARMEQFINAAAGVGAPAPVPAAAPPVATSAGAVAPPAIVTPEELRLRGQRTAVDVSRLTTQLQRGVGQVNAPLIAAYDRLAGDVRPLDEIVAELKTKGGLGGMDTAQLSQRILEVQAQHPPDSASPPPNFAQAAAILSNSTGGRQAAWFSREGWAGNLGVLNFNDPRYTAEVKPERVEQSIQALRRRDLADANDTVTNQTRRITQITEAQTEIGTLRDTYTRQFNLARTNPAVRAELPALLRRIEEKEARLRTLAEAANNEANLPRNDPKANAAGTPVTATNGARGTLPPMSDAERRRLEEYLAPPNRRRPEQRSYTD